MTKHNLTPDTFCYGAYVLFDLLQVNGELFFFFLMHKIQSVHVTDILTCISFRVYMYRKPS